MSDLSRLRARLVRIEKRGRALKAELEELRSLKLDATEALTRSEERRITQLDAEIVAARKDWARLWARLGAEERRYLENPAAPLHFT